MPLIQENVSCRTFIEPVASARPKFPSLADSQTFKVYLGGAMTLLCPAQGFPVPSYR